MNQRLLFKNPVFHTGVNSTCRRGTKWSGASGNVAFSATDSDRLIGVANVLYTKTLRMTDISLDDIATNHDPECRSWVGLFKEMESIYPNFSKREIVTIIYFEPIIQYDTADTTP
jgi:hypothetical protein